MSSGCESNSRIFVRRDTANMRSLSSYNRSAPGLGSKSMSVMFCNSFALGFSAPSPKNLPAIVFFQTDASPPSVYISHCLALRGSRV
jgi:hypothetical protein